MNRQQRIITKTCRKYFHNEIFNVAEKVALTYNIPIETLLERVFDDMAKKILEERMNERLIIENEIKRLGIRFPNGTVNKIYDFSFELPMHHIKDVELEGVEELGLYLTQGENGKFAITGKPLISGDFRLKLKFNTIAGEPKSVIEIPIAFNPNPRDLWKNIKCDSNIIFPKEDEKAEYVKVEADLHGNPQKDIVAASKRGRSHAQEGKPRDDHFSVYYDKETGWYILAVADGAGSAIVSRKGSEIACNTVVDYCRNMLTDNHDFNMDIFEWAHDRDNDSKRTKVTREVIDIIFKGAIKAHEAIRKVAEANPSFKLKDFATTLMFAICKKFDFGWFIASFWVGDGAMAIYNENNKEIKLLGTPDEGEFSGQTRFLTMPEIFHDKDVIAKRLRMAIVPDFTALFLMSDGVSDPMFETDKNLNSFNKWKEFYTNLQKGFPEDDIKGVELSDDNENSKDQLLSWLDFWSPGNHDDRTIAILY